MKTKFSIGDKAYRIELKKMYGIEYYDVVSLKNTIYDISVSWRHDVRYNEEEFNEKELYRTEEEAKTEARKKNERLFANYSIAKAKLKRHGLLGDGIRTEDTNGEGKWDTKSWDDEPNGSQLAAIKRICETLGLKVPKPKTKYDASSFIIDYLPDYIVRHEEDMRRIIGGEERPI